MSSSNSPCAACKIQRRKCTQGCLFAPYFPPDQPQKFANVHKVFGRSNVAKILSELNATQREDAVNSLAYEAEARLRDPIYGCVGFISILQHKLKEVQRDLYTAKKELANYIGPAAMMPIQHPGFVQQHPANPSSASVIPYNMPHMLNFPAGTSHNAELMIHPQQQQHPHQMLEARQQEFLRTYEQQQQQELARFNGGFDPTGPTCSSISPSVVLDHYQVQQPQGLPHPHHLQLEPQLLLQQGQAATSTGTAATAAAIEVRK